MKSSILYLDLRKSKSVMRVLSKEGEVYHAGDISQALVLMTGNDFDYFFVDADTPQAQAFLKHLQHDPQLVPPKAVVLLTDNDDEDCEAWAADTFVTRSRIKEDVPYVFSHMLGQSFEKADVVRIAPEHKEIPRPEERPRLKRFLDDPGRPERTHEVPVIGEAGVEPAPADKAPEMRETRRRAAGNELDFTRSARSANLRVLAAVSLVVLVGIWLFVWGPLAKQSGRGDSERSSNKKKVVAESSSPVGSQVLMTVPMPFGPGVDVLAQPLGNSAGIPGQNAASSGEPAQPNEQAGVRAGEAESLPPAEPVQEETNSAPSVSISGPTTVTRGQAVTFYANATDPDGDSLTYSWGGPSKTVAFSTPGPVQVSVTVTDSHGNSASGSIQVMVTQ